MSNANSATVTPTEKNLRRASMGSIGSGGRTAAANISKMIVSAANATGDKLGRNISSGASGLIKSTKTSDTKFMTPIVTESANTATTPNSVASQLFRAASPSTLEQLEKNFGADSEDDDDEEEYPSRRGSTASMSGGSASRRGSSAGNRERRPSTESEASAIGLFQKNVESYKTKLKQGFHVGFWDGKKILPNGEYVRLNKFDGTLRMQVDGQLSITKQQASFKSLLGIGGASKSEICPIVIGDIVEVMCINSEMMKVYHLDKAEESLLLYVVSMCTNPSVYDPNHKQSNSHGLPSFERMTIIRTPSPTERQVLYNTLRTIMVNGIAQDEHTLSVTGGFRNTEKKQRRLSTRESVLLAKADSVRAAAEIAIAAAEANSAKNTPSKGIGDGNEAAATGSAASPPKHHRRGSTLPLSASGDHEASSVAATAAAKRRASIREAENAKVQELQNQLMTEQANHHKLVVQVMTMSNELNEKDQVIIASKKREEALSAILASKEKVFEQDASARVQLGQKMQALFIEKMDALEQADHYKVSRHYRVNRMFLMR